MIEFQDYTGKKFEAKNYKDMIVFFEEQYIKWNNADLDNSNLLILSYFNEPCKLKKNDFIYIIEEIERVKNTVLKNYGFDENKIKIDIEKRFEILEDQWIFYNDDDFITNLINRYKNKNNNDKIDTEELLLLKTKRRDEEVLSI